MVDNFVSCMFWTIVLSSLSHGEVVRNKKVSAFIEPCFIFPCNFLKS